MGQYKVYEIKQSIFKANDDAADVLRAEMKKDHCFLLNLMSSPGSGKTTTLTRTIEKLGDKMNIGIMEADIDSDVDAERISHTGVKKVIQLHTGGMCHLDADMTQSGTYGNWERTISTSSFSKTSATSFARRSLTRAPSKNAMILSVPEGHDKPLKYPLIFQVCDALIINKIDVLPYFDFDMDKVVEFAKMRNPNIKIFPISAKTGEGMDAWCAWLREQADTWNAC